MVFIILEVSSLVFVISTMALFISSIWPLTFSTMFLASPIIALACEALSAFCLVMEDISSMDEEVSSRVAACSDAPSARAWLEADTWAAASYTSLCEVVSPPIAMSRVATMERIRKKLTATMRNAIITAARKAGIMVPFIAFSIRSRSFPIKNMPTIFPSTSFSGQ